MGPVFESGVYKETVSCLVTIAVTTSQNKNNTKNDETATMNLRDFKMLVLLTLSIFGREFDLCPNYSLSKNMLKVNIKYLQIKED